MEPVANVPRRPPRPHENRRRPWLARAEKHCHGGDCWPRWSKRRAMRRALWQRGVRRLRESAQSPERRSEGHIGPRYAPATTCGGAGQRGVPNLGSARSRRVTWGRGTRWTPNSQRGGGNSAAMRAGFERFQDASRSHFGARLGRAGGLFIPLRKRRYGYGRCLARTGDLLLVRDGQAAARCCRLRPEAAERSSS